MFKILQKTCIILLISIFSIGNQGIMIAMAADLPQNLQNADGMSIDSVNASSMVIDATGSDRAYGEWDGFDIGTGYQVIFNQNNSQSIALNRVIGVNPSNILGHLEATGQVFLVNPNGVLFGQNSSLDVGGLVASALDITKDNFQNDNYVFSGSNTGSVVNYANLNNPGGYIVLLGNQVRNYGSVISQLGSVALAAGDQITLGLDSGNLVSVVVDSEVTQNLVSADAAVENFGTLGVVADGSAVILTAKTVDNVFDKAINNAGIIEANGLSGQDGKVILKANNDIVVAGRIEAEGDVDITSTDGKVEHQLSWVEGALKGLVDVVGGDFTGSAGGDYVLRNGTSIETNGGAQNITAGGDVIEGTETDDLITAFDWEYIFGERGYKFVEFGYYNDNGEYVSHTPLTQGSDIGKDDFALLSGDGSVYGDGVGLYTKFIDHDGNIEYYYNDPAMNLDGMDHTIESNGTIGWEDIVALGDEDFNDAIFDYIETTYIIPGNTDPDPARGYGDEYQEEFPVYYEILSPSQFLSFEPATSIGLYAYHPLTPVDQSAFDDIELDVDAYEFIDDNIKKKKPSPYFGE